MRSMLERRITRLEKLLTSSKRATRKFEGNDARVKKELLRLVKDGNVTWEELARTCLYWMDNDTAWDVVAELGDAVDGDVTLPDDDMIDDSQDAEDFRMPDWDKADAEEDVLDDVDESKTRCGRRGCRSNR